MNIAHLINHGQGVFDQITQSTSLASLLQAVSYQPLNLNDCITFFSKIEDLEAVSYQSDTINRVFQQTYQYLQNNTYNASQAQALHKLRGILSDNLNLEVEMLDPYIDPNITLKNHIEAAQNIDEISACFNQKLSPIHCVLIWKKIAQFKKLPNHYAHLEKITQNFIETSQCTPRQTANIAHYLAAFQGSFKNLEVPINEYFNDPAHLKALNAQETAMLARGLCKINPSVTSEQIQRYLTHFLSVIDATTKPPSFVMIFSVFSNRSLSMTPVCEQILARLSQFNDRQLAEIIQVFSQKEWIHYDLILAILQSIETARAKGRTSTTWLAARTLTLCAQMGFDHPDVINFLLNTPLEDTSYHRMDLINLFYALAALDPSKKHKLHDFLTSIRNHKSCKKFSADDWALVAFAATLARFSRKNISCLFEKAQGAKQPISRMQLHQINLCYDLNKKTCAPYMSVTKSRAQSAIYQKLKQTFPSENWKEEQVIRGLSADILLNNKAVIQIDGPRHFLHCSKKPTPATNLNTFLFEKLGYLVVRQDLEETLTTEEAADLLSDQVTLLLKQNR